MKNRPSSAVQSWVAVAATLALVAMLTLPLAVHAKEFQKGEIKGSWDTTISWGAQTRLEEPDRALIGIANLGTAYSVNGDDGNLNYDKGIFSNVLKLTTEVELNYKNMGAFVRARGFYDFENEDGERQRTPLTKEALKRAGSRADILDAFVWTKFDIGGKPAELRLGDQVLSWGESTFIQGGINAPDHTADVTTPGNFPVTLRIQGIQADIYTIQTCSGKSFGHSWQQESIGGHGDLPDLLDT